MTLLNSYKNFCRSTYWKLESFIVPELKYSQTIYEKILNDYVHTNTYWLDLGCGQHILPSWRINSEKKLLKKPALVAGIDYDHFSLVHNKTLNGLLRGNISKLPFKNDAFNLITANMVFEHLTNPADQLKEVFRVLKPGGILIFHTPNAFGYNTLLAKFVPDNLKNKIIYFLQGRREEDIFPAYYLINTIKAIYFYANNSGFLISSINLIVSSAQLIMLPPIALLELLFIKLLMLKRFRNYRTNIIAILKKPNN